MMGNDLSSDFELPLAKKPRLSVPEIHLGKPTPSPVDEMDDLYDTPPQASASPPMHSTDELETQSTSHIQQSFLLPGLDCAATQPSPQVTPQELTTMPTTSVTDAISSIPKEENRSGEESTVAIQKGDSSLPCLTTTNGETTNEPEIVLAVSDSVPLENASISSGLAETNKNQERDSSLTEEKSPNGPGLEDMSTVGDVTRNNDPSGPQLVSFKNGEMKEDLSLTTSAQFEDTANAEFEIDSSPIQSSSSTSEDSEDSSEDSDDEDYQLLDVAEQARRLMEEDGGSDEEIGKDKSNGMARGTVRTLNEKPDNVVEKPNVAVTIDMEIEELGQVESIVDNIVLVKGKASGESRVLDSGSVLCLEDRTVIGVIAETLGRVQQPLYSIRFVNERAIPEAGISISTIVFYVEQHSKHVFTQSLKTAKGSDASNIHDEEVGDDELEFSDDEAEVEYKRKHKLQRQMRRGGQPFISQSVARVVGEHGYDRAPRKNDADAAPSDFTTVKYEDAAGDYEDLYTPLTRPNDFHALVGHKNYPVEGQKPRETGRRDGLGRGRGSDRGRGDRTRHRNGRGQEQGFRATRDARNNGGSSEVRGQMKYQETMYSDASKSLPPTPTNSIPTNFMAPLHSPMTASQRGLHHFQSSPADHQWEYRNQQPPGQVVSYGTSSPYPHNPYAPTNYEPSYAETPRHYSHYQPPGTDFGFPQQPYHYSQGSAQPHPQPLSPPFPGLQQSRPHSIIQPPNVPPGSFINPAFFAHQQQVSPPQQHLHPYPTQYSPSTQPPQHSQPHVDHSRTDSNTAFQAAQEKIQLLRQLSGKSASP